MKLVASLIVAEVERDRYLEPCVGHLLEFVDEVVLLFDGDGSWSSDLVDVWGAAGVRVVGVTPSPGEDPVDFFAHEGRARQRLLEATLARSPSHVLAIDADEFVADGAAVRRACSTPFNVWTLEMEEIWELDGDCLCVRQDGGWESHPVVMLWRVGGPRGLKILDRALACGRVPVAASSAPRRRPAGTSVLHFGWANRSERFARHRRYAIADGGRFHASAHLDSILWPDEKVDLEGRPWPAALAGYRAEITERASRDR